RAQISLALASSPPRPVDETGKNRSGSEYWQAASDHQFSREGAAILIRHLSSWALRKSRPAPGSGPQTPARGTPSRPGASFPNHQASPDVIKGVEMLNRPRRSP